MSRRRCFFLFLPSAVVLGVAAAGSVGADPPTAAAKDLLTVKMGDCKATRPARITSETSVVSMIFSGPRQEELVKRGTVDVDGTKYTLYLPKAKAYSTKNSKPSDSGFENTSTLISVDQNGDGRLTDDEGWPANLPIRLGDKMFDVAEIAADGGRVVLKASAAPLRGVVVGRRCPPFSFKTADGKEITRETLSGKAVLLDIWSIT